MAKLKEVTTPQGYTAEYWFIVNRQTDESAPFWFELGLYKNKAQRLIDKAAGNYNNMLGEVVRYNAGSHDNTDAELYAIAEQPVLKYVCIKGATDPVYDENGRRTKESEPAEYGYIDVNPLNGAANDL